VFKALPSDEVILKKIESKRDKILKKLNITPYSQKKQDNVKKIATYLITNMRYYEPIKEEVDSAFNFMYQIELERKIKKLNVAEDKLAKIEEELKQNKNDVNLIRKKEIYENILEKHYDVYHLYLNKKLEKLQTSQSKYVLQSLYKILIEKKAVCNELGYAFAYLLNGAGVKNEVLHISYKLKENDEQKQQKTVYHALNVIKGYFTKPAASNKITDKNIDKEKIFKNTFFTNERFKEIYTEGKIRYYDNIEKGPKFNVKMSYGDNSINSLNAQLATSNEISF